MKKVVVGMSGGVDSSVAAALLKEQGYEVIGVTFKFAEDFAATDAIAVCKKLGIKHYIVDYKKEFKEKVVDKFIEDYKKGITPNPCVMCNKNVKLKFLYDQMIKLNCDYMATGHYAKVKNNKLYKSADLNKDQTYFLCEIKKDWLPRILFPLEKVEKEKVRKIAKQYKLDNANKKDSTDVCFITKTFKEYMSPELGVNEGDIIDIKTKEKIGTHKGLSYYTIGQRRGLDIGGTKDRTFVVGKDIEKNILYITIGEDDSLLSDACILEKVNYLSDKKIKDCTAKFRYHQQEVKVTVEFLENKEMLIKYPTGVKSVTPGQVCALYNKEECLGGGIIKEVRKNNKKLWYL